MSRKVCGNKCLRLRVMGFPSVCRTDEGDAVITHPGALCIMVQLLPRLYHHDHAQVCVTHTAAFLPGWPFSSFWLGLGFPLRRYSRHGTPCECEQSPWRKGPSVACDAPDTGPVLPPSQALQDPALLCAWPPPENSSQTRLAAGWHPLRQVGAEEAVGVGDPKSLLLCMVHAGLLVPCAPAGAPCRLSWANSRHCPRSLHLRGDREG